MRRIGVGLLAAVALGAGAVVLSAGGGAASASSEAPAEVPRLLPTFFLAQAAPERELPPKDLKPLGNGLSPGIQPLRPPQGEACLVSIEKCPDEPCFQLVDRSGRIGTRPRLPCERRPSTRPRFIPLGSP